MTILTDLCGRYKCSDKNIDTEQILIKAQSDAMTFKRSPIARAVNYHCVRSATICDFLRAPKTLEKLFIVRKKFSYLSFLYFYKICEVAPALTGLSAENCAKMRHSVPLRTINFRQ